MEREVQKYNENFVKSGRALGELGHPDGPTINLDRASHLITSLKREGNNFVGKARLLETPMGKIAKQLLDEGVKLGVSHADWVLSRKRTVSRSLAKTLCSPLLLIL